MKIMTFNARIWTRDTDKGKETYWENRMIKMNDLINQEQPDIICFQEMMFPATLYIPKNYKRVGISAHHSIFIKKQGVNIKVKKHCFSIFYEYADLYVEGFGDFRLVNIHSRWEEKVSKNVFQKVGELVAGKAFVMCGDFNVNLDDARNNGCTYGFSAREYLELEKKDTFQNYTKDYQHDEIDHFIFNTIQFPKEYKLIETYSMSDHRPVFLKF